LQNNDGKSNSSLYNEGSRPQRENDERRVTIEEPDEKGRNHQDRPTVVLDPFFGNDQGVLWGVVRKSPIEEGERAQHSCRRASACGLS